MHTSSLKEKNRIKNQIKVILQRHPGILFAYIFGSFVEEISYRDIDLGIFVDGVEQREALNYKLNLEAALRSVVGEEIDVCLLNFAPITFSFHVVRGDLLLEQDEGLRSDFVEGIVRKYLDLKPRIYKGIKEAFAT
jgi:predicted nucleotidyltransferase